jgi:hypothetical protein
MALSRHKEVSRDWLVLSKHIPKFGARFLLTGALLHVRCHLGRAPNWALPTFLRARNALSIFLRAPRYEPMILSSLLSLYLPTSFWFPSPSLFRTLSPFPAAYPRQISPRAAQNWLDLVAPLRILTPLSLSIQVGQQYLAQQRGVTSALKKSTTSPTIPKRFAP